MEVRLTDDYLNLAGKDYVLSEVADTLANLSAAQIVAFFDSINVKLPRVLNCAALRGALNQKVIEAKTLNLSDEMMYRLRFYPDFSEFQLQSFYKMAYTQDMDLQYKKSLFKVILLNARLLNVTDENVLKMLDLAPEPFEEFDKFEETILPLFYDFNKDFDGIRKETLTTSMRKSATANDIRDLGAKYGISIPKRLKRDEMQKLIEEGLRKQHKLTEEMKAKLDKLPIINLQRVAKQNGIKVSVDLKKEDLIAYLLNEVDKAKFDTKPRLKYELDLGDGFVFDLSYVMAVEEIEEFVNEQNEEEPKVEEAQVIEEEKPVNEPQVEEIQVVEEEIKEEPIVEEKPQEEVIEETKEEVVETVEETKEEVKEEVKPEQPQEVIREVVKESSFDYEKLTKCIVDVIHELTPILTRPKEVAPAPIINIYNNEEVKKDENKAENVTEPITLNSYAYHNFDSQVSPSYNPDVAATMALADVEAYAKPEQTIAAIDVNESVDNVEEKEPIKVVEVETVKEETKKKKRLTNAERVKNMKIAYARKHPNKVKDLSVLDDVDGPKQQEEIVEETKLVIPAEVASADSADPIPANIVIMTQGGSSVAVPTSHQDEYVADSKTTKKEKKDLKREQKAERKRFARNVANMRRSLNEGIAYDMDEKFFEQTMRIKEYKLRAREDQREHSKNVKHGWATAIKWIIIVIILLALAWLLSGLVLRFMYTEHGYLPFAENSWQAKYLFLNVPYQLFDKIFDFFYNLTH